MRRQLSLGVTAVAAAAATAFAGGATAHAETGDEAVGTPTDTVVLPTGDTVAVLPDGGTGLLPAAGREDVGFLTIPAPDGSGDALVIPSDRADAIKTGLEDPRRYNVTDLAAAGIADAGAASESELDGIGDAGLTGADLASEAAAAQPFTVQVIDRSGGVPEEDFVLVSQDATGAFGILEFDAEGRSTVSLEPGGYTVVEGIWNNDAEGQRTEIVLGMTPVTIGSAPYELVLDAADASPVTVDVPRPDARLRGAEVSIGATGNIGYTDYSGPDTDIYLMPESTLPGREVDFAFRPVLDSPEGADEAYTYNLAFLAQGALPQDTSFTVTEAELAAVRTEYHDLGTPVPGFTCTYGDLIGENIGTQDCRMVPVEFPSERIEYYNADPSVEWSTMAMGGRIDEDGWGITEGFISTETIVLEAGERTRRDMVNGPLGGGTADGWFYGFDEAGSLSLRTSLGAGHSGEELRLLGYDAAAFLIKDEEKLSVWHGDPMSDVELALDGAGRYTLALSGTRDAATGLFATESRVAWTFDFDPADLGDEGMALRSLPTVAFDAEDIEGGWADAGCRQDVALTLEPGVFGGPDSHLTALGLEVSYDDGRTWTEVDLDRDGNTAEATLHHPRNAQYVSIRVTAADDGGNEIAYTTIRSYGLR